MLWGLSLCCCLLTSFLFQVKGGQDYVQTFSKFVCVAFVRTIPDWSNWNPASLLAIEIANSRLVGTVPAFNLSRSCYEVYPKGGECISLYEALAWINPAYNHLTGTCPFKNSEIVLSRTVFGKGF